MDYKIGDMITIQFYDSVQDGVINDIYCEGRQTFYFVDLDDGDQVETTAADIIRLVAAA